jgi:hypothetical protein
MNRVYFPLRSSVEFFQQASPVAPAACAKEGAVLFEQVIFEPGQVITTVGDDMNLTMYRPREELTAEDLEEPRPPAEPGGELTVAIGREDGAAMPAMRTIGETVVRAAYSAQWHSAAIDELVALEVPWVAFGPGDDHLRRLASPIAEVTREFKDRLSDGDLLPFDVDFVAKSLACDATVAASMGASINVTPMFAPIVEDTATNRQAQGADALSFMVPNLEHLSWESIAEYRDRQGSVEARGLLREFETIAIEQEPGDVEDYLEKVRVSIMDALVAALLETEADVPRVVGKEVASLAVSVVPVVGSFIGAAAGIAEVLGQRLEQRQSGLFSLLKLRHTGLPARQ